MGKRIPISVTIFLVACAVLVTFQITHTREQQKYSVKTAEMSAENSAFTKIDTVDAIVRKNYVGEIDEAQLENGLIQGYLYGLGDKYATYLDKDEFKAYTSKTGGQMVGIGIKVIYDNAVGGMYVTGVTKDSPAMEAGLVAGDVITAVDGMPIAARGYYNTINYIGGGEEGEVVTLTVLKGPELYEETEMAIERAVVRSLSVTGELLGEDVGYVVISEFLRATPNELFAVLDELIESGATSLLFDVRNNPGGDLDAIKAALDHLLPEGPIIRIRSKDGTEQVLMSDEDAIDLPMCVLVNGNTASAAELFTAALKDYKKATVVGTTTYGKGTMQTMMQLSDGSALSISTQMYDPPYSENYEGTGVLPDVEIDLTPEQYSRFYRLTRDEDPQIRAAVRILHGEDPFPEELPPEPEEDETAETETDDAEAEAE